jgi:hypothetical protein
MKEHIIGLLSFIVICFSVFWVYYIIDNSFTSLIKTHDIFQERIGDRVILDGDTLRIINYRFMGDEFILEDGRSIHIRLIEKLEVVK